MWKLGYEGDFEPADGPQGPEFWFSGQHQPMLYAQKELVIYDNSNIRNEPPVDPVAHSRGQVYLLDEDTMIADLIVDADLGVYASFLGSAQKLANGNYHFLSGGIGGGVVIGGFPAGSSQSTEVGPDGSINYTLQSIAATYRSFRMKSMYQPAGIPGDIDGDSDVDGLDILEIYKKLFRRADIPYDLNGDGWVTLEDVSEARSQCTLPYCGNLYWETPVIGY